MTDAPPARAPRVPPGHLPVHVWYLAMDERPSRPLRRVPRADVAVTRVRPTLSFYRYLFDSIGEPWLWWGRRRIAATTLQAWLSNPAMELWVPMVDGVPAGMAELDRHGRDQCDLAYFGLMPEFTGQGLGPWLLDAAIDRAFAGGAKRLTVNTCTLDHPAALRTYLRAGFTIIREVDRAEPDPRILGFLPPTAAPHIPIAWP